MVKIPKRPRTSRASKKPPHGKRVEAEMSERAAKGEQPKWTTKEFAHVYEVLVAILSDLAVSCRIDDAIDLKKMGLDSTSELRDEDEGEYWEQIVAEVKGSVASLPSPEWLSQELELGRLDQLSDIAKEAVAYWHSELSRYGSTVVETMRQRRLQRNAKSAAYAVKQQHGLTKDQREAEIAARVGPSVSTVKRLRRRPTEKKGAMIAVWDRLSELVDLDKPVK